MPILRPLPPASSDRCIHTVGLQRCRNRHIRTQLFCRDHLPRRNLTNKSKPKPKQQRGPHELTSTAIIILPPAEISVSSPNFPDLLRQLEPSKSPTPGEIWAVSHESDGLPRSYVRIERIHPADSTAEITPLEFHPMSFEDFTIATRKLPISCGMYRAGEFTGIKEISALCQRIGRDEDYRVSEARLFYRVYPRKGEVWAVYKECDGSERSPIFNIMEVLEGFDEETEAVVAVGLEPFRMKIRREQKEGADAVVKFSRVELMLFSHRIPGIEVSEKG